MSSSRERSLFAYYFCLRQTFEIISAFAIFPCHAAGFMPQMLIVNSGQRGPQDSANQSKRKLLHYLRLVNKKAFLFPLLSVPCTSAPVQRLRLGSVYQTAWKRPAGVPDTPAGLLVDVHYDPAWLFSSLRPSVCGIIPARLIWSWSFISAPAAAAKINQRSFYTRSDALLQLLHLSSPFSHLSGHGQAGEGVIKPSFPPHPPLPEHSEEDRCIILIYAKPHTHRSFSECGGTHCLLENIRCHPIKPPYLTEASFCSPLIWGINLPDYPLSREFVQAFIILALHAYCSEEKTKRSGFFEFQTIRSG